MTILRPPGAKIPERIGSVAARSCQERPGAARGCQRLPGASSYDEKSWYLRIQGRMQIFRFFIVFRVFEKRFWQPFADLINSKACIHEYQLLNFSDLKKVDKTFFKNAIYQSEKKKTFVQ